MHVSKVSTLYQFPFPQNAPNHYKFQFILEGMLLFMWQIIRVLQIDFSNISEKFENILFLFFRQIFHFPKKFRLNSAIFRFTLYNKYSHCIMHKLLQGYRRFVNVVFVYCDQKIFQIKKKRKKNQALVFKVRSITFYF